MKKLTALLPFLLFFTLRSLAYDSDYEYDDESMSSAEALKVAFYCGLITLVGYLIQQVKAISGLGMVIFGIGAFFGVCAIFVVVMNIVAAIVSVAVKVALVLGAIGIGIWILYSIYKAITEKVKD